MLSYEQLTSEQRQLVDREILCQIADFVGLDELGQDSPTPTLPVDRKLRRVAIGTLTRRGLLPKVPKTLGQKLAEQMIERSGDGSVFIVAVDESAAVGIKGIDYDADEAIPMTDKEFDKLRKIAAQFIDYAIKHQHEHSGSSVDAARQFSNAVQEIADHVGQHSNP